MTVHKFGNCKLNSASVPPAESGDTIEEWNLCQLTPHTTLYAGLTGLMFRCCNLTNCDVPADSQFDRCLRVQQSFCSHLHENWPSKGLSECEIDCEHLTNTDDIYIDGVLIETIRSYSDTLVE